MHRIVAYDFVLYLFASPTPVQCGRQFDIETAAQLPFRESYVNHNCWGVCSFSMIFYIHVQKTATVGSNCVCIQFSAIECLVIIEKSARNIAFLRVVKSCNSSKTGNHLQFRVANCIAIFITIIRCNRKKMMMQLFHIFWAPRAKYKIPYEMV